MPTERRRRIAQILIVATTAVAAIARSNSGCRWFGRAMSMNRQ